MHATLDIGLGGVGWGMVQSVWESGSVKVKGKRKLTGTQLLDQVWRHLKKYVPKELSTREGLGTRDAARLEQYVRSFQFRWNHKMNLADALAKRAAKHRG